jgi:hypothetical protein
MILVEFMMRGPFTPRAPIWQALLGKIRRFICLQHGGLQPQSIWIGIPWVRRAPQRTEVGAREEAPGGDILRFGFT